MKPPYETSLNKLTKAFKDTEADAQRKEALHRILDAHQQSSRYVKYATEFLGYDPADAEELVKHSFVNALESANDLSPLTPIEDWIKGKIVDTHDERTKEINAHNLICAMIDVQEETTLTLDESLHLRRKLTEIILSEARAGNITAGESMALFNMLEAEDKPERDLFFGVTDDIRTSACEKLAQIPELQEIRAEYNR